MTKLKLNGNDTVLNYDDVKEALVKISSAIDTARAGDVQQFDVDLVVPGIRSLNRGVEQMGALGYLAPGVDPATIPPHLLPYVRGIDFDLGFGKLAPGTDPDTIPPELLPYVRYISRRNTEIDELKDQLEVTKIERDNFRELSMGLLSGKAKVVPIPRGNG